MKINFVTVTGLAVEMHKIVSWDYLAGLWHSYLPYELLWGAVLRGSARPKKYHAPSYP